MFVLDARSRISGLTFSTLPATMASRTILRQFAAIKPFAPSSRRYAGFVSKPWTPRTTTATPKASVSTQPVAEPETAAAPPSATTEASEAAASPSPSSQEPTQFTPPPSASPFADLDSAGSGGATDWSKSYHGLSTQAFSKDIADILLAPIDPLDVEMKPGSSCSGCNHLQV